MVGISLYTNKLTTSTTTTTANIKFLCSYGGRILPRYPDGKLRYLGGETRVLAVDRSISFAELLLKLGELCGTSVNLRCQLPKEDLDALVSITSDEDLANLIEEYDRASSPPSSLKIRAFLSLPKKVSHHPRPSSKSSSSSSSSGSTPTLSMPKSDRCLLRQISSPAASSHLCLGKSAAKIPRYPYAHGNPSHLYLVHNGTHRQ